MGLAINRLHPTTLLSLALAGVLSAQGLIAVGVFGVLTVRWLGNEAGWGLIELPEGWIRTLYMFGPSLLIAFTAVLGLVWIARAYHNAAVLHGSARMTATGAVVRCLVPVLNLISPHWAISEIWSESNEGKHLGVVHIWWISALLAPAAYFFGKKTTETSRATIEVELVPVYLFAAAAWALFAVLSIVIMGRVSQSQSDRAAQRGIQYVGVRRVLPGTLSVFISFPGWFFTVLTAGAGFFGTHGYWREAWFGFAAVCVLAGAALSGYALWKNTPRPVSAILGALATAANLFWLLFGLKF